MTFSKNDLLFVPLGGSSEIGMNVNLYHYLDSWIMVDLGISFPDDSTPGVDVILPDLKFIAERREKLAGLILTHGHEDHLGAIPYLWSQIGCPIYGSAFTLALLRRKLAESRGDFDIQLHEMGMNVPRQIGAGDASPPLGVALTVQAGRPVLAKLSHRAVVVCGAGGGWRPDHLTKHQHGQRESEQSGQAH